MSESMVKINVLIAHKAFWQKLMGISFSKLNELN